MTTQTPKHPLDLPPLIQAILNDEQHSHYSYCCSFKSFVNLYRRTDGAYDRAALIGFLSASVHLIDIYSELFQVINDFYCVLLKPINVTELAPSLDDSVIASHREATTPAICPRCGLVPDDLYEDTALGCTCALGD